MFNGLKPVVIALVMVGLHTVARKALRGPVHGAVALATFTAMLFSDVSLLVIVLCHGTDVVAHRGVPRLAQQLAGLSWQVHFLEKSRVSRVVMEIFQQGIGLE